MRSFRSRAIAWNPRACLAQEPAGLALARLLARRLCGPDQRDERRAPDKRCPGDEHHTAGAPEGEERARDRRPGEGADALDRAADDVRGGQLLRCSRERGEKRRFGGQERRAEDRGQGGERVDEPLRAAGHRDHAGGADRGGTAEVRADEKRHAWQPVGEGRRERRGERRRDRPDERDDSDPFRPVRLVRVDGERDAVRPQSHHRPEAGELDPAEVRVAEVAPEGAGRLTETRAETAHLGRESQRALQIGRKVGRFHPSTPSREVNRAPRKRTKEGT